MDYDTIYSPERLQDFMLVVEGKIKIRQREMAEMQQRLAAINKEIEAYRKPCENVCDRLTGLEEAETFLVGEREDLANSINISKVELNKYLDDLGQIKKRYWHLTSTTYPH